MTKVSALYLHFPLCRHLCNYCDFYKQVKTTENSQIRGFHRYLLDSVGVHQELMQTNDIDVQDLETIYIGGGTPSLWGKQGAVFFGQFLNQLEWKISPNVEFTMEVNPGGWTKEDLNAWSERGVNRFSVGIQSLDPNCFPYLDRVHTLAESIDTLTYFKGQKVNYSVDLMLGLPHSSERNLKREMDQILKFNPLHFSIYILTVGAKYRFFNQLPGEQQVCDEYLFVNEYLEQQGFYQYEVSNYAREGFESEHNLRYWKGDSVMALGPSATGFFHLGRSGLRYKWLPQEAKMNLEKLNEKELRLEQLYLALRISKGLSTTTFFSPDELAKVSELLENWVTQKWADWRENQLILRPNGLLILDTLVGQIHDRLDI